MTSPFLILHAPNVHTGGGFILIRDVIDAWPAEVPMRVILDVRARSALSLPEGADVHWVETTVGSRLAAEQRLMAWRTEHCTVLCFHGLPPLRKASGRVVVFMQNRLLIEALPRSGFAFRTRVRIALERSISRLLSHRVDRYIVQTPSMANAMRAYLAELQGLSKPKADIQLVPFAKAYAGFAPAPFGRPAPEFEFVYVADGVAHKNHRRLLEAWRLLAEEGLHPRLSLTLGPRDVSVADELLAMAEKHVLRVDNLGTLSHARVMEVLRSCRALIFPSLVESFGLPLIEAQHCGTPIVAAELDYVRDVCRPTQTFDPHSAVSIARAVRRFLGHPHDCLDIVGADQFWMSVRGILSAPSANGSVDP